MAPRERSYLATHPWLRFFADVRQAPLTLWMNLGAIQSKCEHVANVMLPPDVANSLLEVYLAKGVQATTAIEGNTLSEEDVLARVRGDKRELPLSKEYLGVEVDNVIEACCQIRDDVVNGTENDCLLSVDRICRFNQTVLSGLELPDHVVPGEFRKVSVGVGNYRGAPAEDCRYLLDKMCEWINHGMSPPAPSQRIAYGVMRAVLAHLYLAWIHPFGDGNGRTARLVELQILLSVGVPVIAAHLLSNHYNQTRTAYYRQLDYASRSGGDINRFLDYAAQGMFDGLNETIRAIRTFQVEVTWRDYVYGVFNDHQGKSAERRRRLALDLWTHQSNGVSLNQIPKLTADLAGLYAGKTIKTVTRDVDALEEMKLVIRLPNKRIRVNIELLLAFLPARKVIQDSK